jgi:DNA-binding transcriptional MerR regulator
VTAPTQWLSPADAARKLGVSAKALRLYEERGLISPGRTLAGWRAYGSVELERASGIVALRALGLSLAQIARVLKGDAESLGLALDAHQATLEGRLQELSTAISRVHALRDQIASGARPDIGELAALKPATPAPVVAFDLPWPWGGERFELPELRAITWITGPLFSGKTKLAQALADNIRGAVFVGLEREMRANAAPQALEWLIEDGATRSEALINLLYVLDQEEPSALVIDLIEQGLDATTQLAVAAWLRQRRSPARPVFAMTRSSAMLDLAAVGPDEAIILCPANHSPPMLVAPHAGAPGYEVVVNCLGAPDVRARSEGVVAVRATPLSPSSPRSS